LDKSLASGDLVPDIVAKAKAAIKDRDPAAKKPAP
jgi:hypothetical protein